MKTEMAMLPNGNYEKIISPIQHKCISKCYTIECVEYGWDLGNLLLKIEDGDPYEDGYSNKLPIKYCPFCGYQPERSKREDFSCDLIYRPTKNMEEPIESSISYSEAIKIYYEKMRCSEHCGNTVREVQ